MTEDDEGWRADVHADLTAGRKRRPQSPYSTPEWRARRAALKEGACCVLCARFGLQEPATVADHVVPAVDSRAFDGPLQALCEPCHKIKRRLENMWRRKELGIGELNLATGKEAYRLRAHAFGVAVDGLPLHPSLREDGGTL